MFQLSKKDFNNNDTQQLSKKFSKKITIVKFYADWCGHCKRSQPDYELLDKFAGRDFNICMYNVDEPSNKDFLRVINNSSLYGFKVEGYPTHIIFVKGKYYETYEGPRDARSILNKLLQVKTSSSM